ncbi:ADP-forming succinate--CoA ligase subunit beta [Komagataeibacter intermedius]|uniref:Succinate--CoA ligase [ADP-forming] subunit beta n=2 Tax=Komagataeibacter intermedius TaxID=66229 RepID=A0A0N1FB75_9PROT|nr:ADP-forming succinate--CoA ligase subunit beta [Komagataeibacter intermedius]KPH87080.1 malate--CoA ligase subunit beta [Komagataeibacter intermedius AF2]MCF3636659.1 ADP-forming succinate--CoA ligase subunit beta [Komagataeibacter intermedius]GAN88154.1 succinyl-CoA synthetase subunit beta [Komagataeibacter intermedius TF2]GBQ69018.1 succinyl-CoA synthetase subunit beta [Komagataeibacter intermedius NRIC 0521]
MNIHEYQAKALLRSYGMPVPEGRAATTVAEAAAAASALNAPVTVVKAQIHAGGRGAGHFAGKPGGKGGVRLARSADDVTDAAQAMLGEVLVTKQTGPAGRLVRTLYIESGCDIARELYFSMLVDRSTGQIVIVASPDGGMEIEDVAARTPERILKEYIDPAKGLCDYQSRDVAVRLGLKGREIRAFQNVVRSAYSAFTGLDAAIVEINPLVVTGTGDLLALDAKMSFDENALFRHPDIAKLRDVHEEDPREREAAEYGLAYVGLDGNIGCMVNGAGLAMATMDIIKMEGEEPANFLDVGGGASKERVAAAFRILIGDPKVRGILVNIFGGIMRCDVIAEAIIAASHETRLNVPLVVRLAGTNVERGKALLAESGLTIIPADDLGDAARKIVSAVRNAGA